MFMKAVEKILKQMRENPQDVKFKDLCIVCDFYFGQARFSGSYRIYKMPRQGDPRNNIQNGNGKAKVYQMKQVISAVKKLGD